MEGVRIQESLLHGLLYTMLYKFDGPLDTGYLRLASFFTLAVILGFYGQLCLSAFFLVESLSIS